VGIEVFYRMNEALLRRQYLQMGKSSADIARFQGCSETKVNYWLSKYSIRKRSISEAIYLQRNPKGDPFSLTKIDSFKKSFLYGLGLGLYWGEGTKSNTLSIRLGNADPRLLRAFIAFLKEIYKIDQSKLRFGLQIFSDISPEESMEYWSKELGFPKKLFQKPIVTPARGPGTYRKKLKYGVVTVYFNNKKLRDIICDALAKL
jgi:hypothetical protein